jgi:hypothetical protein
MIGVIFFFLVCNFYKNQDSFQSVLILQYAAVSFTVRPKLVVLLPWHALRIFILYITFKKLTSEKFLSARRFLYAIYGHRVQISQIHRAKSSSLLAVIVSGAIKDPASRWKGSLL